MRRPGFWIPTLIIALVLTGCISGGSDAQNSGPPGQITRPADVSLALDDPGAVRAFNTADLFLTDWFFLGNPEAAANRISLNLRQPWESLLSETGVDGNCSFRQVGGPPLDASGTTIARYQIDGCLITPPGDKTATHINVGVTATDTSAWVISIEFD